MSNYFMSFNKDFCCGCRACEQICPKECIDMVIDNEGFIYPKISTDKCISCKMCEKVCPIKDNGYKDKKVYNNPRAYGAYNKNTDILDKSTSGGAFTAIVDSFFDDEIIVFGAEYDKNLIVRHSYVTNRQSLEKFRGSKYVQSDLGMCYTKVKEFLNYGRKVLFSGTPCQVAGLKSFLQKDYDNLLSIDIMCHGVPSPKVFEMYKEYLSKKHRSRVTGLNFRDKSVRGWDTPYMTINFENGKTLSTIGYDDLFTMGFYKKLYQRPICHKCPFAQVPRVSDITIADFWGIEEINPSFKNNKGTSLLLINSDKGISLYPKLEKYLLLEETDLSMAKKFNPQLSKPASPNPKRKYFMNDLDNNKDFNQLRKVYLRKRPFIKRLASSILDKETRNKIKKIIKG